jgi:hypothetical protein
MADCASQPDGFRATSLTDRLSFCYEHTRQDSR